MQSVSTPRGFYSSKKNLCPVCNNHHGCLVNQDLSVLCLRATCQQDAPPGYRFIKPAKGGMGGFFVVGTNNESKVSWHPQTRRRSSSKKCSIPALPIPERDKAIRRLHKYIGLNTTDRQSLRDRGLNDDEIDALCAFSIAPKQEVPAGTPANLPGMARWYSELATQESGFACPTFDTDGRISSWQMRVNSPVDGNKYKWAVNSHLPNGELPVTVCRPLGEAKISGVGLVEGILKPYVAAQKLGQAFVGGSGGNFPDKQLEEALRRLNPDVVTLYPDAGDVINPRTIQRWKVASESVSGLGYKIQFAWWGQVTKSENDVDELPDTAIADIKYLAPDEFFSLSRLEMYRQRVRKEQQKLNSLTYPAIEVNQRYLAVTLPKSGIVFVKSPMGTGKTELIKRLAEECSANDSKLLLLGSRNGLLYQTCGRAGIQHFRNLQVAGRTDLTPISLRSTDTLAMCVDSVWQVDPDNWKGASVIVDEIESVIQHLLNGNTCKKRRGELLVKFEAIIQTVLKSGGRVVLMDAGLTDVSVNYIRSLAPTGTPVNGVVNEWKSEHNWVVELHEGTTDGVKHFSNDDSGLAKELVAHLQDGGIPAIATDSQLLAEGLERYLQGLGYVGLRVDSKTSRDDPRVQAFMEQPDQYLRENKPQYVIYTPTAESGLSITEPFFTAVFGWFKGVLNTKGQLQMLGRVRKTVKRIISSPLYGLKDEHHSRHLPEEILERLQSYHQDNCPLIGLRDTLAGSEDPTDAQRREAFDKLWNPETNIWDSPHLVTWAKLAARDNYQKANLRDQLKAALTDAGHQVSVVKKPREVELKDELKSQRQEIKAERAEAIAQADDISIEQARSILNSDCSTEEQENQAQKAILAESLPSVELTPEFVLKAHISDGGRWLRRVRTDWMRQHPEVQKQLDRQNWVWHLDQPLVALQDIKADSLKLKALERLGIQELLDPDRVFNADCPKTQAFVKACRHNKKRQYLKALNLTLTDKTNSIRFIQQLLEKIGAKLTCFKAKNGKRDRYYKILQDYWDDPDRQAVLAAFEVKFREVMESFHDGVSNHPQIHTRSSLQPGQHSPLCLNTPEAVLPPESACNISPFVDITQAKNTDEEPETMEDELMEFEVGDRVEMFAPIVKRWFPGAITEVEPHPRGGIRYKVLLDGFTMPRNGVKADIMRKSQSCPLSGITCE